jgi:hypothetical protein
MEQISQNGVLGGVAIVAVSRDLLLHTAGWAVGPIVVKETRVRTSKSDTEEGYNLRNINLILRLES